MMLSRTVGTDRRHGIAVGTVASGTVRSGAEVRFVWDGEEWAPLGDAHSVAGQIGPLGNCELHERIHPSLRTLLALGGHWRAETDFEVAWD